MDTSNFDFEGFIKMIAERDTEMLSVERIRVAREEEEEGDIQGTDYSNEPPPYEGSETSGSSVEDEENEARDEKSEDKQAESTHADLYKIATSLRTVDKSAYEFEAIIEECEINNQDYIEVPTSLFFDEVKSEHGADYSGHLGITNTSHFYILYQVKASSPQKFKIESSIGWVYPYGTTTVKIQTRGNVVKEFTDIMYDQFRVFGIPLQFDIPQRWIKKTLEDFWKAYGSELFPSFMAESHDVVNCQLSPRSCLSFSILDFITNRSMSTPYPKVDFPVTPMAYDLDVNENFSEVLTTEWAQRTQLVSRYLKRFNEKTREITWKNKRIFTMCYQSILGVSVCAIVFGSAWWAKMEFWPDLEMSDLELPTLAEVRTYLGLERPNRPKFLCSKSSPRISKSAIF